MVRFPDFEYFVQNMYRSKKRPIDPSSPLLKQNRELTRRVCQGHRSRHILEDVTALSFNKDLKTHDSVFSQVHVCFCRGVGALVKSMEE